MQDPANIPLPNAIDPSEVSVDEIEAHRSREITAKAVSGILLILLKWFKVSRKCGPKIFTVYNLIIARYIEVRISNSTFVGLKLSTPSLEVVCPSRN
jgi:hypothetical protein